MDHLTIIGGGLAGSEAAWQAAERGVQVCLHEMRPLTSTGAHLTANLGELVCSNSLGSDLPDRASGVLKAEMRRMGSMLLECAYKTALPAGSALAVDREAFAQLITTRISGQPKIEVVREEVTSLPDGPTIIASGPLTSPSLSNAIVTLSGQDHLYFFDAIAPIVSVESIDLKTAFRASRYGHGEQTEGDYINCPMNRDEYDGFVAALLGAERIKLESFEQELEQGVRAGWHQFFEGCLPVEILAGRGHESLAFGPMRPVGLTDPRTGKRPYAVVQLRQDNLAGTLFNMVGFQTNLKFPEQARVFRTIPGLEKADFVRYGQMHRNTFIDAPTLLYPTLQFRERENLLFAGQITGVESYMGNIATGLLAGWNAARILHGRTPVSLPTTTILGSLCHYVTHASPADFQPMKANFGILPPLNTSKRLNKRKRATAYAERALGDLEAFLSGLEDTIYSEV